MLKSVPLHVAVADEVGCTLTTQANAGQSPYTVTLELDAAKARADIDLLTKAAKRSLQVRQRLFDLGDLAAQLSVLNVDDDPAAHAGQLRICLQLSDALAELVAAVRAGQIDGLVV